LGRFEALKDTAPENPPWPFIAIVETPVAPCITVNEAGAELRVKLPDSRGRTVTVALAEAVAPPDPVQVRV
jgi:hypothetical protein